MPAQDSQQKYDESQSSIDINDTHEKHDNNEHVVINHCDEDDNNQDNCNHFTKEQQQNKEKLVNKDGVDDELIKSTSKNTLSNQINNGNTSSQASVNHGQHDEAVSPNNVDEIASKRTENNNGIKLAYNNGNEKDHNNIKRIDATIESRSKNSRFTDTTQLIGANKPNGLRNRIRPPPIDIGKVSNFTAEDRPSNNSKTQQQIYEIDTNPDHNYHNQYHSLNTQDSQRDHSSINSQHNNWQSSTTNLKFWSKLNDSCNSNLGNRTSNGNFVNKNSMMSSEVRDRPILERTNDKPTSNNPKLIISNGNNKSINNNNLDPIDQIDTQTNLNKEETVNQIDEERFRTQERTDNHDYEISLNNGLGLGLNNINSHEPSIGSEHDDSSAHGGEIVENGGGNVIGVDNPTPPASSNIVNSFEDHNSIANRSKSNNPFLVAEDDIIPALPNLNNFHRRPASFMAATTSNILSKHQATLDNVINKNQQLICEQLNLMSVTNDINQGNPLSSGPNCDNKWSDVKSTIYPESVKTSMYQSGTGNHEQNSGQYLNMKPQFSQDYIHQNIYGNSLNTQNNNNSNLNEPKISADSEMAICKPPPSASLPHWVNAIYELNNAILEPSSIGGGAENGQFIYIINNGDIILELNHIKISGFTLAEFNELVESKSTHFLSAVQTKHSHSLFYDLKEYLKCSFPKNSPDKALQDLIRENIYRRTIPCTTRPPRPGEVDKMDYHFLSIQQFNDLNERGLLLECGNYGGHYYGTMRPSCDITLPKDYTDSVEIKSGAINTESETNFQNKDIPLYENNTLFKKQQLDNETLYGKYFTKETNICVPHNANWNLNNGLIPISEEELPLPIGWEKVEDPQHGIFYMDHNTQKTQYERPYEIELTKGFMGFGFTLVEADNGMLLVRSIIPDGPAFHNGIIRPGDILLSAVGISVSVLQHTDIAKLFAAFAVGDRVRLTFGRTNFVLGENLANLVPDEYLFSNGANGDMALAINPTHPNFRTFQNNSINLDDTNLEFDILKISLKKCSEQGFGFTLGESVAGQRVKEIQNASACMDLKQGDTLIKINDIDVTQMSHKEVVALLKDCPVGEMINLTIKRRMRFRSKTPMITHSDFYRSSSIDTQRRKCKTPTFDAMVDRYQNSSISTLPRASASTRFEPNFNHDYLQISHPQNTYTSNQQSSINGEFYQRKPNDYSYKSLPHTFDKQQEQLDTSSTANLNGDLADNSNMMNYNPTTMDNLDTQSSSYGVGDYRRIDDVARTNQYNNFMKDDKLMMMQMQQQRYNHMPGPAPPITYQTEDNHIPIYSNSELITPGTQSSLPMLPNTNPMIYPYSENTYPIDYQSNYYANNEEIAMQRTLNYEHNLSYQQSLNHNQAHHDLNNLQQAYHNGLSENENSRITGDNDDEYEYHQVKLVRDNTNSNWGIRLIGGAEVKRAISIGSVVFDGAAFKNGKLKSGDEIILINDIEVIGSTHQDVVKLISSCAHEVSLVIRRKKFSEACEVVLTRSLDEGFGFVIISSYDCVSLIGKIIEGSPAQRCQQLHVTDRIIAVNGREITPKIKHSEIVNMIKETGSVLRLKIIPANCYTVELIKNSPNDNFGFTMRGGSEYDGAGLYILRVAPTGLARDLLNVGDQIIEINGIPTVGMTHQQAASIIMHSDPIVKLKLRRNHQIPPSLLVDSPRELHKFNQVTAEIKTISMTPNAKSDQPLDTSVGTSSTYTLAGNMINQHPQLSNLYQQQDNNEINHQNGMALFA